jgi:short-subunit dehydrogenase
MGVRLLRGRSVLITGASSGIGWQLAMVLARRGARLVLVSRRLQPLYELKQKIEAEGLVTPEVVECDVSVREQVEALKVRCEKTVGGIDVLINNAGRGAYGYLHQVAVVDHEAVVNTNLMGVIYCTHALLPSMLERGSGHLVFVSSVLGELPAPEHAVYGATKFAVSGLAESLYHELAGTGVDVTLIEPGRVRSEFAQVSDTPQERFAQVPSKSSLEVAECIARAIEGRQWKAIPDALARFGIDLRRHFPRLSRFLYGRITRRIRRRGAQREV